MEQVLTVFQAYKAMVEFLYVYFDLFNKPYELRILLSSMEVIEEGKPGYPIDIIAETTRWEDWINEKGMPRYPLIITADPATWEVWTEAIEKVLEEDQTQR